MAPPAAWSGAVAGGPRPQDPGSGFPGYRSGAGLEGADPGNARPVSGAAGRRSRLGHRSNRRAVVRLQLRGHAVWVLSHHGYARGGGEAVPGRYVDHRPGRRAVEANGLAGAGAIPPRIYSATPGSQTLISLNMDQSLSESA